MAGSRFIAMANESVGAIKRAAVNLQVILSLAAFALYFLLSPVIAWMPGGASLSDYIRVRATAFVIPVSCFIASIAVIQLPPPLPA